MPSIWRRFAATNQPGTCVWCGQKLGYWIDKDYRGGERGYAGKGHFCSLRCAFNYATRMVELGRRFEPVQETTTGKDTP